VNQLSHQLVQRWDALCVEDSNLRSRAKTKRAKSWFDASFGELFRQIEYQSLWNRKHFVHVDTRITTFICRIGKGNVPPVAHSMEEISTLPSTSNVKVYGHSLRDAQRVETPMDHV
jgi:hypothetical protein